MLFVVLINWCSKCMKLHNWHTKHDSTFNTHLGNENPNALMRIKLLCEILCSCCRQTISLLHCRMSVFLYIWNLYILSELWLSLLRHSMSLSCSEFLSRSTSQSHHWKEILLWLTATNRSGAWHDNSLHLLHVKNDDSRRSRRNI